jgi:putative hydrolase
MKLVADLHVHTVASGHAYSTVLENARSAAEKGLELIAITDHGPAMPGGPHPNYFSNLRVLPRTLFGVEILKGAEVNIIDADGGIDLSPRHLKYLDVVLAGFHGDCYPSCSVEENTRTLVNAIAGGQVDIIVHPGNPAFQIDVVQVVKAAIEHNVLLEINNSSLLGLSRKGSRENCILLANTAARLKAKVSLGSDAHFACLVGDLGAGVQLTQEAGLADEQIINISLEAIRDFLRLRGRKRYMSSAPQI